MNSRVFYYWPSRSQEAGEDLFLSVFDGELYTHADLQVFEDAEIAHREEQQRVPSFAQLMKDYPTARACAKRHIKNRINSLQEKMEIDALYGRDTSYYLAELKKLSFQHAYLTEGDKATKAGLSPEEIEMAKQTPINNFLKVNQMGKAQCIFHADKTASMHVYNNNRFYCFGCQKSGSIADVVMQLYGLEFLPAINRILGK